MKKFTKNFVLLFGLIFTLIFFSSAILAQQIQRSTFDVTNYSMDVQLAPSDNRLNATADVTYAAWRHTHCYFWTKRIAQSRKRNASKFGFFRFHNFAEGPERNLPDNKPGNFYSRPGWVVWFRSER